MLNWVLSLLVHSGNLTIDEARQLSEKLGTTTHPHKFDDAHEIVEDLFKDIHKYEKRPTAQEVEAELAALKVKAKKRVTL